MHDFSALGLEDIDDPRAGGRGDGVEGGPEGRRGLESFKTRTKTGFTDGLLHLHSNRVSAISSVPH